ncbi:MAG: SWIM zinc finger family protein [Bacilli bacterium]
MDENKLSKIYRHYKKNIIFLELKIENYEYFSYYIRIDYIKKYKQFKLIWFDMNLMEDDDIEKYANYEYIPSIMVDYIKEMVEENESIYIDQKNNETEGKVSLLVNARCKDGYYYSAQFLKYIPKDCDYIADIFFILFDHLPHKLCDLYFELNAELTDTVEKYECQNKFKFNLFKDDLKSLFGDDVYNRGEEYFKESKVLFLEEQNGKYFAVVEGSTNYVVVIEYTEETNETQVHCSCPCEFFCKHVCAVILAIRKKKFKNFYKVAIKDDDATLIEMLTNFKYILCLSVQDNLIEIIDNTLNILFVEILDKNKVNNWVVLEDSKDKIIEKGLEEAVKKYGK